MLLDLDGVLVESTAAVERAWTWWAGGRGLDPARVIRHAHGRPTIDTVSRFAPAADRAREVARVEERQRTDVAGLTALPGALDLLTSSRRLAVVTSCQAALAHARLTAVGLPIPAVLVTSDRLERGKPDPEGYLLAAAELRTLPAACTVVEDSPAGIAAGKAAGMRVLAVRSSHPDERLGEADAIVGDLAGVIEFVQRA